MIEVKNLIKRYGNHEAVKNLNFTIETGEILGFLGPNGAGKTTTMNMMTGYLSPTEGTVLIDGIDIMENPQEAKKKIGYLPDVPPLYGDMTVYEYLKFVSRIKKVPKTEIEKSIQAILEQTDIVDVSKRLIKHLSKGYMQRIGIAQALVGNPDVLILDEPTVGLDPRQIIEIRSLIKELGKNHTIILSSHILTEVSAVCDRIIIINKGSIIAFDTPENLSKKLSTGSSLIIRTKGTEQEASNILSSVADIESIKSKGSHEEGTIDLLINGSSDKDIRETVFEAFSKASHPLLMLKPLELNLEDIFLQYIDSSIANTESIVAEENHEVQDTTNTEEDNETISQKEADK